MKCLLFMALLPFCSTFRLNVIEVIIGENVIYGNPASGPAFDVAFESLQDKYPQVLNNYTRNRFFMPGILGCLDSASLMISLAADIWEYLRTLEGFNIIMSSGCSPEIAVLGDFAREWGVPLFSSIGGDPSLGNKNRYPTVLAYGPTDSANMRAASKAFIDKFAWKTVLLLCDALSTSSVLSGYYEQECANLKAVLSENVGIYSVIEVNFDSGRSENFDPVLRNVEQQGRVIFIFTSPAILRKFLISASKKNMTNGDYIYVSDQTTAVPTLGNITWEYHDSDDMTAFDAFRSLIVYSNPNPDWNEIINITELRRNKTTQIYNYTFTDDTLYNDLAVSAYEMISTIAQVLNESYQSSPSAREFTQLFMNRTFQLPSRTLYVSSSGLRFCDVEFYRLNDSSGRLDEAWHFYSLAQRIDDSSVLAHKWKGPGPPKDIPTCGFRGELCTPTSDFTTILGIALGVAGVAVAVFSFCAIVVRRRISESDDDNTWWIMEKNDLETVDEKRSNMGIAKADDAEDDVVVVGEDVQSSKRYKYQGHLVCIEIIKITTHKERIMASNHAMKLLSMVRHMTHQNVSPLNGIIIIPDELMQLVYDCPERGSLHSILESDNAHFDKSLQRSIIWEILDGTYYIHQSKLGWHGHLSPFHVFLDKRFTVKITGYASAHLSAALNNRMDFSANILEQPFRAPELSKTLVMDSELMKLVDVFAVSKISELVIERIAAEHQTPQTAHQLHQLLSRAQSTDALARPSLPQIMTSLQSILPRKDMVDSIMRTLEKYSEDLEGLISERTQDLMHEREKSDELLRTMIPPKFVNSLRNKQIIPAENFECVTVMFSDLPKFAALCSTSSPLEVTALLNTIYASLDNVIAGFDAYKVETINDSYVVASGLPERNGDRHVVQIALLALKFMDTFSSADLASKIDSSLELRIGFHSGPCAAGVVGLRMPRYCLFGDTINTASRMESHGEESRIHLSIESKEILESWGGFILDHRGQIPIKGKGLKDTYWLIRSC